MSYVSGYTHVVDVVVPDHLWEAVFFSLESLKAHLQAIPGFQRMDVVARDDDAEDHILVMALVNFEYQDQLLLWLEQGITVEGVLRLVDPDLETLKLEVREIV